MSCFHGHCCPVHSSRHRKCPDVLRPDAVEAGLGLDIEADTAVTDVAAAAVGVAFAAVEVSDPVVSEARSVSPRQRLRVLVGHL
jgi:hypothetical protein